MDVNRYWAILRCIDSPEKGYSIAKIKPPLTEGERAWYEAMKKEHEAIESANPNAHFVPANDADFHQFVRDFDPDKEYGRGETEDA